MSVAITRTHDRIMDACPVRIGRPKPEVEHTILLALKPTSAACCKLRPKVMKSHRLAGNARAS
jgi:hypothetical protein